MDRLVTMDMALDPRGLFTGERRPYIVVCLHAAVALIPHQHSLPFPTYFLVEIDGMVRQITSAVWENENVICVIWRTEDDEAHFSYLPPRTRVEVHQVWGRS